jgi:hypothetical protein
MFLDLHVGSLVEPLTGRRAATENCKRFKLSALANQTPQQKS